MPYWEDFIPGRFRADPQAANAQRENSASATNADGSPAPAPSSSEDDLNDTGDEFGLMQINRVEEARIEIVFVHGLGGGRRRSWSSRKRVAKQFWPQTLLAPDWSFRHARLYTFGYPSTKRELLATDSGILDVSESLLVAMKDNPEIRQSENPIVLVGHGFGGLVVKQLFVDALRDGKGHNLGPRIRSLYFLGTPHRGPKAAESLQKMMRLTPAFRVTEAALDLGPVVRMLDSLNPVFEKSIHDAKIEIRTYWENQKSSLPPRNDLQFVVEKADARLHWESETSDFLNTDHRGLTTFEQQSDPNYEKLKNALATTVADVGKQELVQESESQALKDLEDFLEVHEQPEDDYVHNVDQCFQDTCDWFTCGDSYKTWRGDSVLGQKGSSSSKFKVMLIVGDPGAGKSVLSSHIIRDLHNFTPDCSYFYFKSQGRKSKLITLFLSMAYQMGRREPAIRRDLLTLRHNEIRDLEDGHLWRKLFVNCVFTSKVERPQYWVIDGLDECPYRAVLVELLQKVRCNYPLHILITSRPSSKDEEDLAKIPQTCGGEFSKFRIEHTDTSKDIESYVDNRLDRWRRSYPELQRQWVETIRDRADGCFLWVRLVLDSIDDMIGPDDVQEILDTIPKGMDRLYTTMFARLDEKSHGAQKDVLKAALRWAACANPALSGQELEHAILVELETKIFASQICERSQNILYIDPAKKVRLLHETARQYLILKDNERSLKISPSQQTDYKFFEGEANLQIAKTLLTCLKEQIKPGKSAFLDQSWKKSGTVLTHYAATHWGSHVRRSDHESADLLMEVNDFLTEHGIDWIAYIASKGSLDPLIRTAWNLRDWLRARAELTPPINGLGLLTERIHRWTIDLLRLPAKFGKHFLASPTSVYTLVPPFIPSKSMLVEKTHPDQAKVVGIENDEWDDHVCSFYYRDQVATSIANGGRTFAVGLKNGTINVYDSETLQLLQSFRHGNGKVVKGLKYSHAGTHLLSFGPRSCEFWDIVSGVQLWQHSTKLRYIAAAFVEGDASIISMTQEQRLVKQDSFTGKVLDDFEKVDPQDAEPRIARRELVCAEFCEISSRLATVQRRGTVKLSNFEAVEAIPLSIEDDDDDDPTYDPADMPVVAMTFSRNRGIPLLGVAYRDGALRVFDHLLPKLQNTKKDLGVSLLASSPDGHTLAAGNERGEIMLLNFDTLDPLHIIVSGHESTIRALVFIGNGQRLADIRDSQCTVWEPPALNRTLARDSESESDTRPSPTEVVSEVRSVENAVIEITALFCIPNTEKVICGLGDGSLVLFSSEDGQQEKFICYHADRQPVRNIVWTQESRALATLSGHFDVMIDRLTPDWTPIGHCAQLSFDHPVEQLLIHSEMPFTRLLVATTEAVTTWCLKPALEGSNAWAPTTEAEASVKEDGLWTLASQFLTAKPKHEQYLLVQSNVMRLFSTVDLAEVAHFSVSTKATLAELTASTAGASDPIIVRHARPATTSKAKILLELATTRLTSALGSSSSISNATNEIYIVDSPLTSITRRISTGTANPSATSLTSLKLPIGSRIEHVIGISSDGASLYFLDKDFWVCTFSLNPRTSWGAASKYLRHFIIPDDWISQSSRSNPLLFAIGNKNKLIFVRRHQIAVIRGFHKMKEVYEIKAAGQPSRRTGTWATDISTVAGHD